MKNNNKGGVLITALIYGTIMVSGLVGYLAIARNSMMLSNRSFNLALATNIAESGIEAGLHSINSETWTDWSGTSSKKSILLTTYLNGVKSGYTSAEYLDLNRNVRANAKVVVYDANSANPYIVVKSWVWNATGSNTNPVTKWVKLDLASRSLFAKGLVAKNGLNFKGNNPMVDSYNSTTGGYVSGNIFDTGSIGSLSIKVDSISLINADVWGYAAVGTATADDGISVGPNGRVGPYGTVAGKLDPTRVSSDFRSELPSTTAPNTFGSSIVPAANTVTLVGSTDPDNPKVFSAGFLTYNGNNSGITITGHVSLVVSGLRMTGNNSYLSVGANSSLKLYSTGPITVSGNGILNASNKPIDVQIYTVDTPSSPAGDIAIKGNGTLTAVVYAPNSNITINGNGDTFGAIIGNYITLSGNGSFHYDLSLANFTKDQPLALKKWTELSQSTDIAPFLADF
jgi:hypothetical protein